MINFAKASKADWLNPNINVWLAQKKDGKTSVVENLTLRTLEEGEIPHSPIQLDPTTAQQLMDSLWDCGLRPSEGSGSAGAMLATQNHLEDMRALVFKERKPL